VARGRRIGGQRFDGPVSVAGREAVPGATRNCPHCRALILESAVVCPGCRHHVRFGAGGKLGAVREPDLVPLRVEGTVRHGGGPQSWEYSVVVSGRYEKGEEVSRQVVGVGPLAPGEGRTFTLAVELFTGESNAPGPGASGGIAALRAR
jgi:hypothetical protein